MTESENPRRIGIRFKDPAGSAPARTETASGAAPDSDQCPKPVLKACKSLKQKITAAGDNGIQTSSDAKRVARSANIPDWSDNNSTLSSNSLPSSSGKQEIECGGGSMKKLPSGFGKQKQFNPDTLFRLIRCDTPTNGRKRCMSSLGLPTSSLSKRSKTSSSEERRPSSINSLPDVVLVEILCRLPCSKFVFQCKSVSKRWNTLITDPYFIGRFVTIRSYKKIPEIPTLINKKGEEFPYKKPSSPKIPLLLRRIKNFYRLIRDPVVVATYRDLVLCCRTEYYQRDYYICNAYTMQYVALPPPQSRHEFIKVGFICDSPYYNCKKDDWEGHNIQLNANYRCKVVRILFPNDSANVEKSDSFSLNMEIYSSETGEWKESVASSPQRIRLLEDFSLSYNGMLCWLGIRFHIIGLDPFNDNNSTTSSSSRDDDGIIDQKLRFTVFEGPLVEGVVTAKYLGVCGGFVRMCNLHLATKSLYVWELKEQDCDRMVDGDAGKLCLSGCRIYPLDPRMFPDFVMIATMLAFDPNDNDILYLAVGDDNIKCNIRTRKWSKIVEKCPSSYGFFFPVVLPWWPTPVPRLPLQDARSLQIADSR